MFDFRIVVTAGAFLVHVLCQSLVSLSRAMRPVRQLEQIRNFH
jgi:hypothetical protein